MGCLGGACAAPTGASKLQSMRAGGCVDNLDPGVLSAYHKLEHSLLAARDERITCSADLQQCGPAQVASSGFASRFPAWVGYTTSCTFGAAGRFWHCQSAAAHRERESERHDDRAPGGDAAEQPDEDDRDRSVDEVPDAATPLPVPPPVLPHPELCDGRVERDVANADGVQGGVERPELSKMTHSSLHGSDNMRSRVSCRLPKLAEAGVAKSPTVVCEADLAHITGRRSGDFRPRTEVIVRA